MDINNLPDELIWETLLHASPQDLTHYLRINKRFLNIIDNINFQEQYAKIHGPKFGYHETIEDDILYRNGKKKYQKIDMGEWDQGQKIGNHYQIIHEWHQNGQLKIEYNYSDWKLDGIYREWHENGQLAVEENYVNAEREGIRRSWHINGQLLTETNYIFGQIEGIRHDWYENGQLKIKENYVNGQREGIRREWYPSGRLKLELDFVDGKLV